MDFKIEPKIRLVTLNNKNKPLSGITKNSEECDCDDNSEECDCDDNSEECDCDDDNPCPVQIIPCECLPMCNCDTDVPPCDCDDNGCDCHPYVCICDSDEDKSKLPAGNEGVKHSTLFKLADNKN